MNISFDVFRESCNERGYTQATQQAKNFVVHTRNGVKAEIKPNRLTFGWLRTAEEIKLINNVIVANGHVLSAKHNDHNVVNVTLNNSDVLNHFWSIVDLIEQIEEISVRERGMATKVFSKEVDQENKFTKIAMRYVNAIANQDQEMLDLGRVLLSGDSIDRVITRGYSENFTPECAYREHVVPCVMIHNEIIRMVLADLPITDISQMIASNLAIVMIHTDEAYKLDVTFGLRTSMPAGWNFGDNVYARLDFAGIKWK